MSKEEKLIIKFLQKPKDFTYDELKKMLNGFGYIEDQNGKTSGSRVAFIHDKTKHIIRLHKPHPGNELKMYQIDLIRKELEEKGIL
jgi:hypothetical protein